MTLAKYRASNHRQQVKLRGPLDEIDDRAIHPVDFGPLDDRFGFTVDVAAAAHNARCARYYDLESDGLEQPWTGETVWCNPPYSDIAPWVRKAWQEHSGCPAIVVLLPANRTEQQWWQLMIEPYRDRAGSPLSIEFLPGRMRFMKAGQTAIGPNERPPFGCLLSIWQPRQWDPASVPSGGLFEDGEPA